MSLSVPPAGDPIDAVVFDFHATLVDEHDAAGWLDVAWASLDRPGDPAQAWGAARRDEVAAYLAVIWEHARVIDPLSERDLSLERHREVTLAVVAQIIDDVPLALALHATMESRWEPYADTLPVLQALRERGVRLAVLSNIGMDIRDCLAAGGLLTSFDAVVLSCEVGVVKPDPKIFAEALARLDVPAERALMVGDSWQADTGGAALGMRTLVLPRTGTPVHGLGAAVALVDAARG